MKEKFGSINTAATVKIEENQILVGYGSSQISFVHIKNTEANGLLYTRISRSKD